MIAILKSTLAIIVGLWVIWSSAFLAIKLGLSYSSPEAFAVLRVLAAIAVLLVVVVWRRSRGAGFLGRRGMHRYGMLLGATNVAGFLLLQNAGMVHAQIGIASVLIYTQPLLVALGAALILRERLTTRQTLGLLAGWLGVVLVVLGELDLGLTPVRSVVLLLGAALAWAIGTPVFKGLPPNVSVWSLLLWQNIYGLLPVSLVAVWAPVARSGAFPWPSPCSGPAWVRASAASVFSSSCSAATRPASSARGSSPRPSSPRLSVFS